MKEFEILTVNPNGETETETFDRKLKLADFYSRMDCTMIELINRNGLTFVIDEEGLFKPDPKVNEEVSKLLGQRIVGIVIMMPSNAID